jgi:hypothetical protein
MLVGEKPQFVATAAYMFHTDFAVPGLVINVGPQGYLGWLNGTGKTQAFALAGGVNARYEVVPSWHLGVYGYAFFSPGIITFGAKNLYDFSAGADVHVTENLTVLAGYRWMKFTLENQPDDEVQNEVYAGLRWRLY